MAKVPVHTCLSEQFGIEVPLDVPENIRYELNKYLAIISSQQKTFNSEFKNELTKVLQTLNIKETVSNATAPVANHQAELEAHTGKRLKFLEKNLSELKRFFKTRSDKSPTSPAQHITSENLTHSQHEDTLLTLSHSL